jgi:uncharacterized protein (TIGR03790 family)
MLLAARAAALEPAEVLVVVNALAPASVEVGAHYVRRRGIPEENVVRISTRASRKIPREVYERDVRDPIRAHLDGQELRSRILCIVTTYGVPYVVAGGGGAGGASLDSELAALDLPSNRLGDRWILNPYYAELSPGVDGFDRRFGSYLTSRLDGPDPETAVALVERAIEAEEKGVDGRGYFDARGYRGRVGYATGDYSIRSAYRDVTGAGFPTVLDDEGKMFGEGDCPDATWYWGWYSRGRFIDSFEGRLARGAVACHIASSEAVSLREGTGWCLGLLRAGATAVMGPVDEPYLTAFPRGEHFFRTLLSGASLGEAYWRSQPQLSWMMVLVGDPLYRPFRHHPRHFLRAEEVRVTDPAPGGNGDGIPSPGETVELRLDVRVADGGAGPYPGGRATVLADSDAGSVFREDPVEVPEVPAGGRARLGPFRVRIAGATRPYTEVPFRIHIEGEIPRQIPFVLTAGAIRLTWSAGAENVPRPSPDGSWLAYRHGEDLVLRNLRGNGEDRRFGPPPGLLPRIPLAWAADSAWLLVGLYAGAGNEVRPAGAAVFGPGSDTWLPVPGGDAVEDVAWGGEGVLLIAARGAVARWRPGTDRAEAIARAPEGARLMRFARDASRFAYVKGEDLVFADRAGTETARATIGSSVGSLRLDAGGRTALATRGRETFVVSADPPTRVLRIGEEVVGAALAPRGGVALVLDRTRRARIAIPAWERTKDLGPAAVADWDPAGGALWLARLEEGDGGRLVTGSVHRFTLEGKDRGVVAPVTEFGAVTDLHASRSLGWLVMSCQRETAVDVWAVVLPRGR